MTKHNYPKTRKPTGPRPNAGRPAKLVNPVRLTTTLSQEQVDWLKKDGHKAAPVIRRLIWEEMKMMEVKFNLGEQFQMSVDAIRQKVQEDYVSTNFISSQFGPAMGAAVIAYLQATGEVECNRGEVGKINDPDI